MSEKKICINCKSIIDGGKAIITKLEAEETTIVVKCPLCFQKQTLVTLERLNQLDGFKRFLDQLEVRNPE